MKSLLLVVCLGIGLIACENDPNVHPNPIPTSLPNLTLGGTLHLLPTTNLEEAEVAIFVNELGEELTLFLTYERGILNRNFKGIIYQAEYITVNYDENKIGSRFFPSIRIDEEYDQYDSHDEVLSVHLLTEYNGGFFPSILFVEPSILLSGTNLEHITIAGRTFNDVYANLYIPPQFDSYTKVYYTTEQGIVGFEGEQHEMWALERIE